MNPRTANRLLALLLLINLFNYIDRQVLSAVLQLLELDSSLFDPADPWLATKLGLLTSAFLVSYTLLSPVFGWFGDRGRRWVIVGIGVLLWSLASGGSGLATGYLMLLATRCLVGIGEAAYGPVAPAMISDMFPDEQRGKKIAVFYLAIPVGSALGFVIGSQLGEHFGWRAAFFFTFVGILPALACFRMPEPPRKTKANALKPSYFAVMKELRGNRSFKLCCAGMTCTTFMLGGVAAWAPTYIFQRESRFEISNENLKAMKELKTSSEERVIPDHVLKAIGEWKSQGPLPYREFKEGLNARLSSEDAKQYSGKILKAATTPDSISLSTVGTVFGGIVVIGGFGATLAGAWFGDWLKKKGVNGAYFHAAGWTTIIAWPFFVASLFVPFPWAWALLFVAVFFLFFNTGPANTILANVTRTEIRATAFAINILVIHLLGDVISPPIIGLINDTASLSLAFLIVSFSIPLGGLLWVLGASSLERDTARES